MFYPAISPKMMFRVEASGLSLEDKFMKHEPRTEKELWVKNELVKLINKGMEDFYRPRIDPSFTLDGDICFWPGGNPSVGKSCIWWDEKAKSVWPNRNSRLGTKDEYMAFVGVLIKMLVEDHWRVDQAWNVICNDSSKIGHYREVRKHLKHVRPAKMDSTGNMVFSGLADLANVSKILAPCDESDTFWTAGGSYIDFGSMEPIANLHIASPNCNMHYSVGWIVFDK